MASRLYRTTRPLFLAVARTLLRVQISRLGAPTLAALITLVVTGLIVLDARPAHTRLARFLPARCHDAFNRLLCAMPFSTHALSALLVACAKRLGCDGYLIRDDVIVEKARAKQVRWANRMYSFKAQRSVWGFQVIVLLWRSADRRWRIPIGFRVWRPKRSCRTARYQTKLHLAEPLVRAVVRSGLPITHLAGDTLSTACWCTKRLAGLGVTWHGALDPQTHVVWRGRQQPVRALAPTLKLKGRKRVGLRAMALRADAPKDGHIRLVVVKNRHGNWEYLVANALHADLTTVIERTQSRWSIETVFRDRKQFASLAGGQCRRDQALVRHIALVFLTFVVLPLLRDTPDEAVASVKERWQPAIVRDGERAPAPLRACPPELRPTA